MNLTFVRKFAAIITLSMGVLATNLISSSIAQAEEKKNDIGFFGNGTTFGIQGKIEVSPNFSIRPEIGFGGGSSVENRSFATPISLFTPAFTTAAPFTLKNPYTVTSSFTVPIDFTANVAIGNIPAGTVIRAGTNVPAGTVLPTGLTLPAGNLPALTIPTGTSIPAGTLGSKLNGTTFGIAATYDFNLDSKGKSTAYIGPKIAFSSSSGAVTLAGADIPGSKIDINETKIGLVLGTDYAVSDDFTIGANLTYNLSRSLNGNISLGSSTPSIDNIIQSTGSSLDFAVRVGYRF
jgi:opacity protein-like surface antigen